MKKNVATLVLIGAITLAPFSAIHAFAETKAPVAAQDAEQGQPTQESQNSEMAEQSDQSGMPESSRPQHRVDEQGENGFDTLQIGIVAVALIIAIGLAYRAGRRRRDK